MGAKPSRDGHEPPAVSQAVGARLPASSSQGVASSSSSGQQRGQQLDARQQQEREDAALARRLHQEELAQLRRHMPQASEHSEGLAGQPVGGQPQHARAMCPFCNQYNEFVTSGGAPLMNLQCGSCLRQFQVSVAPPGMEPPTPASSSTGAGGAVTQATPSGPLAVCRRCGTVNQFPVPASGQPCPDTVCGFCGARVAAFRGGSGQNGPRLRAEHRLIEQLLQETAAGGGGRGGRGGSATGGPMVRVNIGNERRMVPLALLLALMAEQSGKQSNAAQAADIAALPTRKLKDTLGLGEQSKCTICLDEFGDGDDVKTLPCLHIYHQRCIEQWLRTDNSCPVCKTPIGMASQRLGSPAGSRGAP